MNIGVIGCGKLGLPVAVALSKKFPVVGYDLDPALCKKRTYEHKELGPTLKDDFQTYFDAANLTFAKNPKELVEKVEVIFIAVQTPHEPAFDGSQRMPVMERKDFDYTALVAACKSVAPFVRPHQTVAVISTMLPGTMRREIVPIFKGKCSLNYNPFFIAMGTVMRDFERPEFVLLGNGNEGSGLLWKLYSEFYGANQPPFCSMSYESAELCKVAYNCVISTKITIANALMELCHAIPGANVDDVTRTLAKANKRITSPAYLTAGTGDGGGCLTANTKISLLDGREVPIKELVGLPEFYVYAYDKEKQEVVPGRAHSCRRTLKKAPILEVMLDNGESIRCTYDHPFLLRNGRYIEARTLREGDSLMPLYRRTLAGYERVRHPQKKGKASWETTHLMVRRWKYGKLGTLAVTHHKDMNKRNNAPFNILALTSSNHSHYHNNRPERLALQSKVIKKLRKQGKVDTPEQRKRTSERNHVMNAARTPEQQAIITAKMTVTQRRKVKEGTHHTVTNNPAHQLMKEGRHNFQVCHPMHNAKSKESMLKKQRDYRARQAGFESQEAAIKIIRELYFRQHKTEEEIAKILHVFPKFVEERLWSADNHKVVAIRKVGRQDVYNFEVDKHHNYAVSAGVFVHNCHPRDAIAMSWLGKKLGLSYNPFEVVGVQARESQAEWLVHLLMKHGKALPKIILGKAFKPETNLTNGSYALLCSSIMKDWGIHHVIHDPHIDGENALWLDVPAAALIACKHECFKDWRFPPGSVVIDPHRYIPKRDDLTVIYVGVGE